MYALSWDCLYRRFLALFDFSTKIHSIFIWEPSHRFCEEVKFLQAFNGVAFPDFMDLQGTATAYVYDSIRLRL